MTDDQKTPEWAAGLAAAFGKALGWRVALMVIGFAVTIVGGVYYALEVTVRPLQEQITNNQTTLTAALNNANSTVSARLIAIEGSLETRLSALNTSVSEVSERLARLDERSSVAIGHIEELRVATAKQLEQSNELNLKLAALNARLEGASFQGQNAPVIREQNWRQTDDPRFPNGLFQDIDLNDWVVEPMQPLNYVQGDISQPVLRVSRKDGLPRAPVIGVGQAYELVKGETYRIGPGGRVFSPPFDIPPGWPVVYSAVGHGIPLSGSGEVCFELNSQFATIYEMAESARSAAPEYVDRYDYISSVEPNYVSYNDVSAEYRWFVAMNDDIQTVLINANDPNGRTVNCFIGDD